MKQNTHTERTPLFAPVTWSHLSYTFFPLSNQEVICTHHQTETETNFLCPLQKKTKQNKTKNLPPKTGEFRLQIRMASYFTAQRAHTVCIYGPQPPTGSYLYRRGLAVSRCRLQDSCQSYSWRSVGQVSRTLQAALYGTPRCFKSFTFCTT